MFVIVGERINTSRKVVRETVENRDEVYIKEDVKRQAAAGATHIDINAGTQAGQELEDVQWLARVVQEAVELPLCIDSVDPNVLKAACDMVRKPPMVNSISLEKSRCEPILSFLQNRNCSVIGLCMSDAVMPASAEEVIDRAGQLVSALEGIGMKRDQIYLDPLIQPISTDVTKGVMTMDSVRGIMQRYPGVHTICGLSNISYGMPQRKLINQNFLAMLMCAGLDSVILDPLDNKIMTTLKTIRMLMGKDSYCMDFIKATTAGKIVS